MGGCNSEPGIFITDSFKQKRIPWAAVLGSEGRDVRCISDRRGDKVKTAQYISSLFSLEVHCDQWSLRRSLPSFFSLGQFRREMLNTPQAHMA